ncbi:hypothetical protein TNCV_3071721 [Trichonephila clavipes]|nr:hypothetical protein TNCV_3071721 [Trichonephila clavipes]
MKIGNNGNLVLGQFDESTPCLMIVLMNCQTKLRINPLTAVKSVTILESTMGAALISLRCSLLLCVLWLTIAAEMEIDPVWENIFKARSDDDWRTVWHTERHRRCYHDLLVHMDWVCQKDIYAVKRKKKIAAVPFLCVNATENRVRLGIEGKTFVGCGK